MIFAIRPKVWPGLLSRILRRHMPLDYWLLDGRAFMPAQLSVDLTYRCNARCAMCCQSGENVYIAPGVKPQDGFLDMAAFEAVLLEMRANRPTVYLTGGEPLLHPEVSAMIAFARDAGCYVSINTNGLLLEKRALDLIDAGADRVILSVSPTPELCLEERNVQYKLLRAGAQRLRSGRRGRRPILSLTCVVTPVNCAYLSGLAAMARDLGADGVTLQHLMFSDEQLINAHAETLKRDFNEHAAYGGLPAQKNLLDLSALQGEIGALRAAGLHPRLEPAIPYSCWQAYYSSASERLTGRCLAPWTTLVLMPDGGLSCCRPLRLGRAGADSVKMAWNSPTAVSFRQRIKHKLLPGCARCCAREYLGSNSA